MSQLMNDFAELCANRPLALAKDRENGVPIVEYTGSHIPSELIYASGAEAYPMWRGGEPEPPEAVLDDSVKFLNPFARTPIGCYYLGNDAVVANACMYAYSVTDCHNARLAELLEKKNVPVCKVGVPADMTREADRQYYIRQINEFIERLEHVTGTKITDEALRVQIELTNKISKVMRKIDNLRKLDEPLISGLDFIKLNHYSELCGPAEALYYLTAIYDELVAENKPVASKDTPRVAMMGRCVAVGDYIVTKAIEESGAIVVTEVFDEAYRWFERDISTENNLVTNLCDNLYTDQLPICNFQPCWDKRYRHLKQRIKDYKVDGVAYYMLVFDEIYDMEYTTLSSRLAADKVPVINIQTSYEYTREAMGPLATKIDTFTASLKGMK